MSTSPNDWPNGERSSAEHATGPARSPCAPRILGDFELRRPIGRGGMGTVYEAWQRSLQRTVAVKVLNQAVSASSSAVIRFQREAQAAAKLHHPHIVPIFAFGEEDGTYYYAMELIDGPGLNAIIAETRNRQVADTDAGHSADADGGDLAETVPLGRPVPGAVDRADPAETRPPAGSSSASDSAVAAAGLPEILTSDEHFHCVAEHIASVADALDYAHAHGVVHRDIKPHNLLLNRDGTMLISDFGLARLAEQPGVTVTGELIGSPLYMSPEQVRGGNVPVDHRTDICSLGATMYEWLTLKPPYPGQTREQVISRILTSEPPPLRMHNPRIPTDLETICLKAIERDPNRRYRTAGEMRDDLRRYVASQPIRARRAGVPTRIGRLIGRHQLASLAILAMVVALVLSWALVTSRRQVASQTAIAEQEKQQTDKILDLLGALAPAPGMGGALRLAEKAMPKLTPEGGADPTAAGTPDGIARRAALDFYDGVVGAVHPSTDGRDEALAPLRRAIELSRADPRAAMALVDTFIAQRPEETTAIRLRAALCGRLGLAERMLEGVESLLHIEGDRPDVLAWRGLSYLLLRRHEDALADLDRALDGGGRSAWYLALRGLLLIQAERVFDALRDLDDALTFDPDMVVALLGRACGRANIGNISGAMADLTHVLELEPGNADVLALRGDRFVDLADYEAAERDYEQAMKIGGQTPALIVRYLSALSQHRNLSRDGAREAEPAEDAGNAAASDDPSHRSATRQVRDWLARVLIPGWRGRN